MSGKNLMQESFRVTLNWAREQRCNGLPAFLSYLKGMYGQSHHDTGSGASIA